MSKRLLMLGGSRFQVPAILFARRQGHYVITCDYLPDNPGHRFADEYHNLSTTDCEDVLQLARKLRIDGVVAYASDPAAPTAAFVGNELGLPSNPYESVLTLTRKDRYRRFLAEHGFHTPYYECFATPAEARGAAERFRWPVVVKPVDSSGSKGVTVVREPVGLDRACRLALSFARFKAVIVEEYVDKEGFQIAGDGFVCNGRLVFRCFANEHFDRLCNPLVPIGESFPSDFGSDVQQRVHDEVQRLLKLLDIRCGALNFDIRIDRRGRVFLMEIGPRNGGNLIPQVIGRATGVDLVGYTVSSALGMDCSDLEMAGVEGFHACYMLHAQQDGEFDRIDFSDEIENRIVSRDVWPEPGQPVARFDGSHQTLGTLILEFESFEQMLDDMEHMERHVTVRLR